MKTLDDTLSAIDGHTISGAVMKIEVVSRTMSGGYHLDITLDSGAIIEVSVPNDKLDIINQKIFETAFFMVKPLSEPNRYESSCIVFGKSPEYHN